MDIDAIKQLAVDVNNVAAVAFESGAKHAEKKLSLDDLIFQFTEDLDFDALKGWCDVLSVDYEEPPIDDMYPDWEAELRGEMNEAMIILSRKE